MLVLIEWIATLCSLTGAVLNARHRIEGFYVWTFGNVFWVYLAVNKGLWGLFSMTLAFTAINIMGIYSWRRKGK